MMGIFKVLSLCLAIVCLGSTAIAQDLDEAIDAMELACGIRYAGPRSETDHGRFYCMRAYAAQCTIKSAREDGAPNAQQIIDAETQVIAQMRALVLSARLAKESVPEAETARTQGNALDY